MVASGIPDNIPHHASETAKMALDILEKVRVIINLDYNNIFEQQKLKLFDVYNEQTSVQTPVQLHF